MKNIAFGCLIKSQSFYLTDFSIFWKSQLWKNNQVVLLIYYRIRADLKKCILTIDCSILYQIGNIAIRIKPRSLCIPITKLTHLFVSKLAGTHLSWICPSRNLRSLCLNVDLRPIYTISYTINVYFNFFILRFHLRYFWVFYQINRIPGTNPSSWIF